MAGASYAKMLAGAVTFTITVVAQISATKLPRTADGKPDLNGIWQSMNTADWDLQAHGSEPGPASSLGAIGGVPPGESVVEDGTIPYFPAAEAQQKENYKHRRTDDPEIKCFMPGVPRTPYLLTSLPFSDCPGCQHHSNDVSVCRGSAWMDNPGKSPSDT
jgi:hypothetical protein